MLLLGILVTRKLHLGRETCAGACSDLLIELETKHGRLEVLADQFDARAQ